MRYLQCPHEAQSRRRLIRAWPFLLVALILPLGLVIATETAALAGDTPGYNYGTDLGGPAPSGGPPWSEPNCNGYYGYYDGEINSVPDTNMHIPWANDANESWYTYSEGIGAVTDYDLTGPAADPNFKGAVANGTEAQGSRQLWRQPSVYGCQQLGSMGIQRVEPVPAKSNYLYGY